ncbi:MAG: DUF302 domain-containing protein [Hyphomicrobiaceae bacterium]|nr:DUF302 domain-containing protein [Hyphomicrobiaceae bacterium]
MHTTSRNQSWTSCARVSIRAIAAAALLTAGLLTSGLTGSSVAAAGELVVKESQRSVKETIEALAAALEKKGIKIVARVDHAAGARAAGLELAPSELLIFGNPKLGTPLMQSNATIGLDLPMKVLAWQTADGKVMIGYTAPDALAGRHAITDRAEVLATMTKALDGLTNAAAGAPKP